MFLCIFGEGCLKGLKKRERLLGVVEEMVYGDGDLLFFREDGQLD